MGWFSSDEIVTTSTAAPVVYTGVEQILIAVAVLVIAAFIVVYIVAKTCNKVITNRVSTTARREIEINRLNNGTTRV